MAVEGRTGLIWSGALVPSWYKAESTERKFSGCGGAKPLDCRLLVVICLELFGRLVFCCSSSCDLLGGCGASRASV